MCHSSKCCSEELNSPPLMNSLISLFIPDKQLSPLTEWGSGGKVESSHTFAEEETLKGSQSLLSSYTWSHFFFCFGQHTSLIILHIMIQVLVFDLNLHLKALSYYFPPYLSYNVKLQASLVSSGHTGTTLLLHPKSLEWCNLMLIVWGSANWHKYVSTHAENVSTWKHIHVSRGLRYLFHTCTDLEEN